MKRLVIVAVLILAALAVYRVFPRQPPAPDRTVDPETSVVKYLESTVRPGEPVEISRLRKVFTTPEEARVLDHLFNTVFRIPMTVVQYQTAHHRLPTVDELAEQFNFKVPGEMAVLLRVLASDPRIPKFLELDPATGQITKVDAEAVLRDDRFGRIAEHSLYGLESKPVPQFSMDAFGGGKLESHALAGQPHLIYFWFSNCPPCVKTAPMLANLYKKHSAAGLKIVAANADRILDIPDTDSDRERYLKSSGLDAFMNGHVNEEMQQAFGNVLLFPTLVLVNRQGTVVKQLPGYQEEAVLEGAIQSALKP